MSKIYLVTGSSGFIGSEVLKKIKLEPYQVYGISSSFILENRSHDTLSYPEAIELCKKNYNSEIIIIHCAWSGVGNKFRNNSMQVQENIFFIEWLTNIASVGNVRAITAIGSQAEYGIKSCPITEVDECDPLTVYGKTKLAHFFLIDALSKAKNIRFNWVRVFSTYGIQDSGSWLIPSLIYNLYIEKPMGLTNCTQTWDYLHVEDAADAIVRVTKSEITSGVYNLGSGQGFILKNLILKIAELMDKKNLLQFGKIPMREDEPSYLVADITKLRNEIDFMPRKDIFQDLGTLIKEYGHD